MVDTVFTKSKTKTPLKTAFSNVKKPTGSTGHMDTSNVPQDIKDKVAKWTAQAHHNRTMKKPKTFNEFLNETPEDEAFDAYSGLLSKFVPDEKKQDRVRKLVSKYMKLVSDGNMLALKNKQPWAVDYAKGLPKKIDDINKKYYGKDFDTKSQPPLNLGSTKKMAEDVGAIGGGNATHGTATTNMVGSTSKPLVIKKLILGNKIARRKKEVV